jgi:2OG-Fe(II) oxygenase superfamily
MAPLEDVLSNRTWLRRQRPFPHVVGDNVFREGFYAALAEQLGDILDRRIRKPLASGPSLRSIPGYDAYGLGFDRAQGGALSLFHTTAWRDLLCGLFEIKATPYVFAGAHYHAAGSQDGFIHNDCNPVWFPVAGSEEIQIPNYAICDYKTGAGPLDSAGKVQVVRGVAMIFYVLNDDWRPGDGGETGLYDSKDSDIGSPIARCCPVNNTLVAFECTPSSFHTFISNQRSPRISIIMWVHRSLEDALERFGADRLERWA